MSDYSLKIAEAERAIARFEELVVRGRKFEEFREHPLFRELVTEGYFLHEAASLVHGLTEPGMSPEMRADSLDAIRGVGHAKRYFDAGVAMGRNAADQLPKYRAYIDELRMAEAEEALEAEREALLHGTDETEH